ncbi:MAG: NADH-quinone oxidoreductase subunit L, partial [Candidatus Margulisiibacteriota bacterium]
MKVASLTVLPMVLPLLGWTVLFALRGRVTKRWAGTLACATVGLAFLTILKLFWEVKVHGSFVVNVWEWFRVAGLSFSFSFLIDPLSVWMGLIVTGVGFLIHLYSIGYMQDDPDFNRFFSYLNLFVFFMLFLVFSDSYLGLFIGWEGVGLCSYLLIGFWYDNPAYHAAAKKAFLMNRIGDLGFILGILVMVLTFGTTSYLEIFRLAPLLGMASPILTLITLLFFVGATGKSAQFPLYTWLPDAMAGPTPVSALIHAATMVIAGIYMIARSHVLYTFSPFTMDVVIVVGTVTAIVGGLIALGQTDIKKVLAYSTVSQLGMMVVALGLGAYSVALFHMTTHAFFKALLFLSAGSVIHALGGEQDMTRMGGLRRLLPVTSSVFLVGILAIVGFPPLSGFFSKDAILIA